MTSLALAVITCVKWKTNQREAAANTKETTRNWTRNFPWKTDEIVYDNLRVRSRAHIGVFWAWCCVGNYLVDVTNSKDDN